jgi:Domain of unknown function (DUF4397)
VNAAIGRRSVLAMLAVGATAVLSFATASGTHATSAPRISKSSMSAVYVIQGVPGVTVAVTVDGKSVAKAAAAKDVVGPLRLRTGSHEVTFSSSDWTVRSTFDVNRVSQDVVLHWPAELTAKPEVTVFGNDVAPLAPGKGRVTVAHTAVVPPADIRVDKKVLFSNIANGEFVSAVVPATTYSVAVVPTGQPGPALLGPLDLPVQAGVLTRVFAIGQPTNGSMDAVVQVLPVAKSGSGAPGAVDAGEAGLVATNRSGGVNALPAVAAGLAALVTLAVVAARRRLARP